MTSSIVVYGTATAVVALVLYGIVQLVGRRLDAGASARRAGADAPDLNVVVRTRIGVGRSLVVVDVQGRRLLLGSTRQQWTALADLGASGGRRETDASDTIEIELARAIEASRQRRGGHRS